MLAAKFAVHPVDEAISRGHVSVRSKPKKVDLKDNRFSGFDDDEDFKPRRRVSFKGDNVDTLMKPPCETKVFDAAAPASSVSSDEDTQVYPDEEEYIRKKRSKTAWKPKFQMTAHSCRKSSMARRRSRRRAGRICVTMRAMTKTISTSSVVQPPTTQLTHNTKNKKTKKAKNNKKK